MNRLNEIELPKWLAITLRYLWYLFLFLLLFLFSDTPERGFRYWGL